MSKGYKLTYVGCLIGISAQALITNLAPILFVPFMSLYGFELWQLAIMVGVNFASQLLADFSLSLLIDKISTRILILLALAMSTVGLIVFALMPFIAPINALFGGFLAATVIFAFSSGMQEVLISPIVDAIPGCESKSFSMSLLHSFYAWGQVITILVISLFLRFFGYGNWYVIILILAFVPLAAFFMFTVCPVNKRAKDESQSATKTVLSPIMILCMLAIFLGGGSEIIANQYISTFCTVALGFEKYVSDIVCMGLFAVCMGLGRVIAGNISKKVDMSKILFVCSIFAGIMFLVVGLSPSAVISMIAAILSGLGVSILWPGVLTVAGDSFPMGGAFIFAVLAVCGDLGGSAIPTAAGFIADNVSLSAMFVVSSAVPFACAVCHAVIMSIKKKKEIKSN